MAKSAKTVMDYINNLNEPVKKTLAMVRKAVNSAAPDAEENIGYGIPYYKYKGSLIAYMAHKNHCSFVTMSYDVIKALKNDLNPYKISGTTIRFPHDKPLPASLIKTIVKARIKENNEKASAKENRSAPAKKSRDANTINDYMKKLKHPLKKEMEAVRKIIKEANKKISERIKWNAPSYYYKEDLVTFNHRNPKAVHLVFHHPGIVKIKSALLEGDYKDRRMVYFKDMKTVKVSKKELDKIMNQLIKLIDK